MTSFGYAMSGRRSTGSRKKETKPRKMTATNSIAVATGRRIEPLARDMSGPHSFADVLLERDHRVDPGEACIDRRALLAGSIVNETLEIGERKTAQPELLLRQLHALAREFRRPLGQLEGPVSVAEVHQRRAHVALDAQPLLAQRLTRVFGCRVGLSDLLRNLEAAEQRHLRADPEGEGAVARVQLEKRLVALQIHCAGEARLETDLRPTAPPDSPCGVP